MTPERALTPITLVGRMDAARTAPAVVAVVVTDGLSSHLEDHLVALGSQDYPNLRVLVVDYSASGSDTAERVHRVLRGAALHRVKRPTTYAAAANEGAALVTGAAFLLICRDHSAPSADAVRVMVEEALQANAGAVGPKLVSQADDRRLVSAGIAMDRFGDAIPNADVGELDQGQHDSTHFTFGLDGGFLLMRADLFVTLGGFDPTIEGDGAGLELCWRARLAGAQIAIASDVRVRVFDDDLEVADEALSARHSLRALLRNSSFIQLLVVVPVVVLRQAAVAIGGLLGGRTEPARAAVQAWTWNLSHGFSLLRGRLATRKIRRISDGDLSNAMNPTQRGLRAAARASAERTGTDGTLLSRNRELWNGVVRFTILVWLGILLVVLVGSRGILGRGVTEIHEFVRIDASPGRLLRQAWSGWNPTGLGSAGVGAPAQGLLGLAGLLFFGRMAGLQTALVLGALPVAALGAWRLTRPLVLASIDGTDAARVHSAVAPAAPVNLDTGPVALIELEDSEAAFAYEPVRKRRRNIFRGVERTTQLRAGVAVARLVAPVLYLATPLPYNAIARGSWRGLILWAAAPWLLAPLLRTSWDEPLGTGEKMVPRALALGLVLALVAAFSPAAVPMVMLMAVALAVSSLLLRPRGRDLPLLVTAALGVGVAAILLAPWSIDQLRHTVFASYFDVAEPGARLEVVDLIRFRTGPMGAGPLGFLVVAPGLLPLFIGQGWRFRWAARLWVLILVSLLVGLVARVGPGSSLPAEAVLAPVAVALAMCGALGLIALELDLPGRRFGWRQVAAAVGTVSAALTMLVPAQAMFSGRWKQPTQSWRSVLSWMDTRDQRGLFRVAWLGPTEAVPGDGWRLGDGITLSITEGNSPWITQMWPARHGSAWLPVKDVVESVRGGTTTSAGDDLRTAGIRYLVVVGSPTPKRTPVSSDTVPSDLLAGLEAQLDLRRIDSVESGVVYENVSWRPVVAEVVGASDVGAAVGAAAAPVMQATGPASYKGKVEPGVLLLSQTYSKRWAVEGVKASDPIETDDATTAFVVSEGGNARIVYRDSTVRRLASLSQIALVFGAIFAFRFLTRRGPAPRRRGSREPGVPDAPPPHSGAVPPLHNTTPAPDSSPPHEAPAHDAEVPA